MEAGAVLPGPGPHSHSHSHNHGGHAYSDGKPDGKYEGTEGTGNLRLNINNSPLPMDKLKDKGKEVKGGKGKDLAHSSSDEEGDGDGEELQAKRARKAKAKLSKASKWSQARLVALEEEEAQAQARQDFQERCEPSHTSSADDNIATTSPSRPSSSSSSSFFSGSSFAYDLDPIAFLRGPGGRALIEGDLGLALDGDADLWQAGQQWYQSSSDHTPISSRYELQRLISQSERSRVYRALDSVLAGQPVAVKMLKKGKAFNVLNKRELHALQKLASRDHPNIVRFLGMESGIRASSPSPSPIAADPGNSAGSSSTADRPQAVSSEQIPSVGRGGGGGSRTNDSEGMMPSDISDAGIQGRAEGDKDGGWLWVVTEWVDGASLLEEVKRQKTVSKGLDEAKVRIYFRQMVAAVQFCHERKFCHRDIKLENFMLDWKTDTIKLIDFGTAIRMRPNKLFSQPCGSHAYMAPELVLSKPYNQAVDVWALGVCLFALLTGRFPFSYIGDDIAQVLRRITKQKLCFPPAVGLPLSHEVKDLLHHMLTKNWKKRIDLAHLLLHPWLLLPGPASSALLLPASTSITASSSSALASSRLLAPDSTITVSSSSTASSGQ